MPVLLEAYTGRALTASPMPGLRHCSCRQSCSHAMSDLRPDWLPPPAHKHAVSLPAGVHHAGLVRYRSLNASLCSKLERYVFPQRIYYSRGASAHGLGLAIATIAVATRETKWQQYGFRLLTTMVVELESIQVLRDGTVSVHGRLWAQGQLSCARALCARLFAWCQTSLSGCELCASAACCDLEHLAGV